MSLIHRAWLAFAPVVFAVTVMGCSASYSPGLGELMNLTQMRHAKLWFAGQEHNWRLAQYELDELQEGFDDVVRSHRPHEDSPVPLSLLVPRFMTRPMGDLRLNLQARGRPGESARLPSRTAARRRRHAAEEDS